MSMKLRHVFVSLLWLCALSACSSDPSERAVSPPLLKVAVREAAMREIAPEIALTGELVPALMLRLMPETDGLTVERVLADVGDRVERGDALIAVDDAGLRLELIQARAEYAQATFDSDGLRRELARIEQVIAIGGVSANERDVKRSALRAAEQRALAAAAARDLIARRLNRARLSAPAAGKILARHVEVGDRTGNGNTPYFVIAADGQAEFESRAGLRQLQQLREGMTAVVRPADGASPLRGRVRIAADAVSGNDRLGQVRIALEPDVGANATAARIGTPATALIRLATRRALFVPAAALRFSPDPWVWIVDRDNRVRRRDLRLGAAVADGYEALQGLRPGDRLVADAGALLVAGDRVEPISVAVATSAPPQRPASKSNATSTPGAASKPAARAHSESTAPPAGSMP
jgi:HlyD family secretion protein